MSARLIPSSIRLRRFLLPAILLSVGSTFWMQAANNPSSHPVGQIIRIDMNGTGKVYEGIGAASAGASSRLLIDYPEPQRSQILDYLFKPGYGAELQHLKVEIGSDVNSTDGAEPSHMRSATDHNFQRGYEWWLMEEARKRNPNIILDSLAWGAPGWIGNGRLYSNDMANYVADFLEGAKIEHGLDIAYTGIWNERVYDAAYVKQLHEVLTARKLDTKIVCCDEYPGEGEGQWQIAEAIKTDPALNESVDVLSVHYPWIYNHSTTPAGALDLQKPLWSSEDQPNDGGGPIVSRDWRIGGRLLAKLYNRNYLEGGFTKTEIWSPITSYYDILAAPNSGLMYANTPWSGHYQVQGAIWATAHTTQFAEPGWRYDDSASGYLQRGGSYVTLIAPDHKSWSTIIESIDARVSQVVQLQVPQATSGTVHVWETNNSKTFTHVNDLKAVDGFYSLAIDPDSLYSVTTTTGQGSGSAVPPPPAGYPLPYKDNFDSYALNGTARYLADQDGAFEIQPCRLRSGKCLTQVVTVVPTPWSPLPDPFTLAGNSEWKNYKVSAEVQIPNAGVASVFGRIDSANVFADNKAQYPAGYGLILKSDGKWQLISTAFKKTELILASGALPDNSDTWHHLEIKFNDASIEASIDGRSVTSVADSSHTHGMFSLGCNWAQVQFANLSVNQ